MRFLHRFGCTPDAVVAASSAQPRPLPRPQRASGHTVRRTQWTIGVPPLRGLDLQGLTGIWSNRLFVLRLTTFGEHFALHFDWLPNSTHDPD